MAGSEFISPKEKKDERVEDRKRELEEELALNQAKIAQIKRRREAEKAQEVSSERRSSGFASSSVRSLHVETPPSLNTNSPNEKFKPEVPESSIQGVREELENIRKMPENSEQGDTESSASDSGGDGSDTGLFDELREELEEFTLSEKHQTGAFANASSRSAQIQSLIQKCCHIFIQGEVADAGDSEIQTDKVTGDSSLSSDQSAGSHGRKRPRVLRSGSGADDGDGEDNGQRIPSSKRPAPDTAIQHAVEFACPFRKHNPRKYSIFSPHRSCTMSSWKEISRLKEHLYRCHRIPIFCKRCKEQFKTRVQRDQHELVDKDKICEVKIDGTPDGLTEDQEKRLKSKRKVLPLITGEDRWRDIYRILFPNENEIPSPYFEPACHGNEPSAGPEELSSFVEYIRNDQGNNFRTRLQELSRQRQSPLEPSLIDTLVRTFQDSQQDLLQSFQETRNTSQQAGTIPPTLPQTPIFSRGEIDSSSGTENMFQTSEFFEDTLFEQFGIVDFDTQESINIDFGSSQYLDPLIHLDPTMHHSGYAGSMHQIPQEQGKDVEENPEMLEEGFSFT